MGLFRQAALASICARVQTEQEKSFRTQKRRQSLSTWYVFMAVRCQ